MAFACPLVTNEFACFPLHLSLSAPIKGIKEYNVEARFITASFIPVKIQRRQNKKIYWP